MIIAEESREKVGIIKHYIDNIENIERGFKDISKKYCRDKQRNIRTIYEWIVINYAQRKYNKL